MRKLATIRVIEDLQPIPDADAIEVATVGGWKVVVKKGEFKVGELAVYIEVDAWVPTELAPFLSKGKEPREYEGVKGERLKTVKLRGQISQGLLLPIDTIAQLGPEHGAGFPCAVNLTQEGFDLTEALSIKLWEAPIAACLAGQVKSTFPCYIPKTDQERIQNLKKHIEHYRSEGATFEVTEKLEGSSMTVFIDTEGEFCVCSRNMNLKETEGNTFWETARRERLEYALRSLPGRYAIQGELIGPGIQGNIYGLKEHQFHVFDIYDITKGLYLTPLERWHMVHSAGLRHVPRISPCWSIRGMEEMLDMAQCASALADTLAEGLVWKHNQKDFSFKVISNAYLLKGK